MPGTITATWTGSNSRTPTAYVADAPPLSPLAVQVANTAGQWLFAVVSWRQDAGTAGVLQYPSTITVSDDADNFWIPVSAVPAQTGIVRSSVWMAPAARAAEFVFFSPTGYQPALTVLILEVTASCPWYSVAAVASKFTNQGTTVSLSQSPAAGLFTIGVLSVDNNSLVNPATSTGWTFAGQVITSNGANHTGDMSEFVYTATTTGSAMTISETASGTCDLALVMITVHGVDDTIAFPYTVPGVENWPVLITEIASGPVLNANPAIVNGVLDWSASNAALAAVTWPVYQPYPNYQALITPSLSVTPGGSTTQCNIGSENEPVSPVVQYTALAFVYSVAGFGVQGTSGIYVGINWYTSGSVYISTTQGPTTPIPAGGWTQLTLPVPVSPPPTAAFGSVVVTEVTFSGNVPSSAVYYVGYAGFGPADAYEDVPADEIAWTDVSTRNFTQDDIKISRGIQYEQQSLEAGTMTVNLANNDGQMMFGNILSPYWPTIGDTDVPIRLRAVWQQSVTPYYVLFSGFTDQIDFGWAEDDGTWYGYAAVEASDAWSRLTSQMLGAAEQEVLEDNPVMYCTCSLSGTNLAPGATVPVFTEISEYGSGGATASFTSTAIQVVGDQGVSCWQSTGTSVADLGFNGVALTFFPPGGLPSVASGLTAEFWMSPQALSAAQPATNLTVCTCWSGSGPMWTISVDNTSGAGSSTAKVTVYDKATGAGTTTTLTDGVDYLTAGNGVLPWYFTVTFSQTSLTVGSGHSYGSQTTVSCNFASLASGLSWGGNVSPSGLVAFNLGGTPGFMSVAIYGTAVTPGIIPPARLASHWQTAFLASPAQLDTARLALIAGYAGATPAVLAMRCLDLPAPPAADVDPVTAVTDTNGQVTSDYFTNIAASTLAFMFVNGAGSLVYRRRLEAYDRQSPQWVLGENAPVPLNANTLGQSHSTADWFAFGGATLTPASLPAAGPLFLFAGLFHGDGSTANPQIHYQFFFGVPVTPGQYYTVSCSAYSPQGWANGVTLSFLYQTSGGSGIVTQSTATTPMAAGSVTYLTTTPMQAPQTAAFALLSFAVVGTPASSVQFYVTNVVFSQVSPVIAGGINATAPEAPYLPTAKLSSDRALLFNQAVLTQYGTNTATTFTGSSLVFAPTSGVLVTIQNDASVTARAGIPYTATIYLDNTAQAVPYVLDEPSMEDFGNWITQTLAAPLLRPDTVSITPAATVQAMLTALGLEVGDTVTYRRRPQTGGAPEIQVLTYASKLTHSINVERAKWDTQYELSPFQQGTVLACDDVLHGTLTGGNLLGW